MEIIYQKTRQTPSLAIKEIYGVYGQSVYCMQKFIKQGKTIQLRTGKLLGSYKDYESLESKLFLVSGELLSDPIYLRAVNSLDYAGCEYGKYHMCIYPDPTLILSIKKYYLSQIAQNVL